MSSKYTREIWDIIYNETYVEFPMYEDCCHKVSGIAKASTKIAGYMSRLFQKHNEKMKANHAEKIRRIRNLYAQIEVYHRGIQFLEKEASSSFERAINLGIHATIVDIQTKIVECDKHIKRELGL